MPACPYPLGGPEGGAWAVLQPGDRIGGRYVLEQRLGLGGMGEVWLAELEGAGAFRRRVGLKMLAPERRGGGAGGAALPAQGGGGGGAAPPPNQSGEATARIPS